MHCSSCGARLPPTSHFCPYCGTQIGGTETSDRVDAGTGPGPWETARNAGAQQEPPPQDASLGPDFDPGPGTYPGQGMDLEPDPEPAPRGNKKKTPRSSLKEPPRPKMPLWQLVPLLAATIGVVGLLAWGGMHLWQTRDAVKTVTNHLNALMRQNYTAAYSMTASDFRQNTTEAGYTATVRNTQALAFLAYYAIEDRTMADNWGIIKSVLIDRGGKHTQASFDMVRESGNWRIHRVRLGEQADDDPETVPVSKTDTTDTETSTDPNATPQTIMNKKQNTIDVNANRAPNSKDDTKTNTSTETSPPPKSNTARDGTAQKSKSEEK